MEIKISRVGLSIGETVNAGDYESVRVDVHLYADVDFDDPGVSLRDVEEQLHGKAHQVLVLAMAQRLLEQQKRKNAGNRRYLEGEIARASALNAPDSPPTQSGIASTGGGKW